MLDYLLQIIPTIADGLKVTIALFCVVWVLSIPGGIILALLRLSKLPVVDKIVEAFVYLMRGTPLMLQILFMYFALPIMTDGAIQMDDATAAVVTFVLNYAAYICEIFRGGIQGVPIGQREAGEVLGMTRSQIFFKVTLLQMVKRVVPPMSNEIITLVKDTSLARIISCYELTFTGYSYMKAASITWPLFYTAVFYLAFVGILTILFNYIEKRLSYFR